MEQDEIIWQNEVLEMARQAGFDISKPNRIIVRHSNGSWISIKFELEAFAKLVAAKEREACEAVCNKLSANKPDKPTSFDFRYGAGCCAQVIRARGEA